MARRKRVGVIQRQLEAATKLAAYQGSTGPAAGTAVKQRQKQTVGYTPLFGKTGALYEIEASTNALLKFGGASELGLTALTGTSAPTPAPRGFKPSMIHLALRVAEGVRVTARVTGNSYIRYQTGEPFAASNTQNNFAAPICSTSQTPAALLTVFGTAETTALGEAPGGRVWLITEKFPERITGAFA
jgi:hypothetical protein